MANTKTKQGNELPSKTKRGQKQAETTPEGLQALINIASQLHQAAKDGGHGIQRALREQEEIIIKIRNKVIQ